MTTQQAPLGSGFGRNTTAADVLDGVDLTGKTIIVTGGASGIGEETTRAFAKAGAKVIVAVRAPERARMALADVTGVQIEPMDLADPDSVDAFTSRFNATGRSLHILINNAGIMACPLARDVRGYESQFVTNHLGHFQLTVRLWPALQRAGGARVVNLSSGAHRRGPVQFDDINFERTEYDKWKAYGQSKTANVLFAVGLDQRGERQGVRAFAAHPGVVNGTGLYGYLSDEELSKSIGSLGPSKTIAQGAATSVWCAASSLLDGKGGVYCENADIAQAVDADKPTPGGVRPWAIDGAFAERLWRLSETMTGTMLQA